MSTTRRFLTRLGHHLQEILEPYPTLQGFQMVANQKCISCHQGQEEGVHEPDNPHTKERSGQDQQVLAMVHETINAPVNHTSSDIDPILSVNRAVRSANNTTPNLCHELSSGGSNPPNSNPTSHGDSPDIPEQNFLWSQSECEDNSSLNPNPTPMATFTVDHLIGRSLLLPSGQDTQDKTRGT